MNAPSLETVYQEDITQVIQEIFEMSAFMDVQLSSEDRPYDNSIERLRADILIFEPLPGEIRLILPRQLLCEITKNINGIQQMPGEESQIDVLSELINVIAGRVIKFFIRNGEAFGMGFPRTGIYDVFLKTEGSVVNMQFNVEDRHYFWVVLAGQLFRRGKD